MIASRSIASRENTTADAIPGDARRNVLATLVGRTASVGLNLLSTLVVIHNFDPGHYGNYLVVLTLITLPDLATEISIFEILMREIAKAPGDAAEWLGIATLIRGLIGAVLALGFVLASAIMRVDAELATCLRLGALVLLINSFRTPSTYFRAQLLIHWDLGLWTLARAVELALTALIIHNGGGIEALMGAKAVASAFFVSAIWLLMIFGFGVLPRVGFSRYRPLASASVPLGIIALLFLFQLKGDVLLIDYFNGPAAAGSYGAVAQIPEFAVIASNILTATSGPLLARTLGQGDRQRFQTLFQRFFDGMLLVLPGLASVTCMLGYDIVDLAFGPAYLVVVGQFRILIWVAALIPMAALTGVAAMTLNLQRSLVRVEVTNILIYLAANCLLLPMVGTMASAGIRLSIIVTAQVWTCHIIRKRSGFGLSFHLLPGSLLAACLAAAATAVGLRIHPLCAATVGAFTYFIALKTVTNLQPNPLKNIK